MTVEINRFDGSNVDSVSHEMMKALDEVGKKFGVSFGRKGIRYSEGDFRVTVTAKIDNPVEGANTKAENDYEYNRFNENLPPLGTSYESRGKIMTIIGWNTRARKYPVNLMGSDGKKYKASPVSVRLNVHGDSSR